MLRDADAAPSDAPLSPTAAQQPCLRPAPAAVPGLDEAAVVALLREAGGRLPTGALIARFEPLDGSGRQQAPPQGDASQMPGMWMRG